MRLWSNAPTWHSIDVVIVMVVAFTAKIASSLGTSCPLCIALRYTLSDFVPCQYQSVYYFQQVWTPVAQPEGIIKDSDGFFKSTTLAALGHRVQLGHPPGHRCPIPTPSPHGKFTVIDTNGIHSLIVDFCGCFEGSLDHGIQIRQFGWYPATVRAPRSAATMRVLQLFQLVSFESKTSTQDFYRAIERLTDNTGLEKIKVRWYHLCIQHCNQ